MITFIPKQQEMRNKWHFFFFNVLTSCKYKTAASERASDWGTPEVSHLEMSEPLWWWWWLVVVVVTGDTGSIITPPSSSSILHQSPPRRLPAANGPSHEMWTRRERMNNLYLISHFLLSAIQTRLSFGSSPLSDSPPPPITPIFCLSLHHHTLVLAPPPPA